MRKNKRFPNYRQFDAMDCGPTCLKMIAEFYGKIYSLEYLRDKSFITRNGVSMLGICEAAESIGLKATGLMVTLHQLIDKLQRPCILHWRKNHFVVCYKVSYIHGKYNFHISDPATGLHVYSDDDFKDAWLEIKGQTQEYGTVLKLEPTEVFFQQEDSLPENKTDKLAFLFKYLSPYKKEFAEVGLSMLLISVFQISFPFLTQSIVDYGISNKDMSYILLLLIAQILLLIGKTSVEFIRGWLLLHINSRINISLISKFLSKLLKLPISFFETRLVGDIMQRIGDHKRIEDFLVGNSLSIFFSLINLLIYSVILAYYKWSILIIFIIGNNIYILWILYFMKYRREIDNHRFYQLSKEQSKIIQLVTGIQDIKLNNCERQKRWQWEQIQVKIYKLGMKSLALGQFQQAGSLFFCQITNIIITFIAANSVIGGSMTLGMMVSVTYIVGQLTAPIEQLITFIKNFQDAQISLERLNEIHNREDETQTLNKKVQPPKIDETITISNLSFSYSGAKDDYVLNNINLTIPQNKVTAIVGNSGSGKTTLLKLLLGFYESYKGSITVNGISLTDINPILWRRKIGVVMQDGFLFSDTIAHNIALGVDNVDNQRLEDAARKANIYDFICKLPLGFNTIIGMEGVGLSQGQKQRVLIARIIYKNPHYIFLDEATNSLDANNEKDIMNNLQYFYRGRTVIVVAHRLSTVKNADNIVVIDHGEIVEQGTHEELVSLKSYYYKLVQNQLELGT